MVLGRNGKEITWDGVGEADHGVGQDDERVWEAYVGVVKEGDVNGRVKYGGALILTGEQGGTEWGIVVWAYRRVLWSREWMRAGSGRGEAGEGGLF